MAVGFTYRHYILKDHLGSWTTITDAEGNVEQELSYDAWGNLRDPETWYNHTQAEPVEAPMFDRGYTGHEHLDAFGLINMNGRMCDPMLGRMLSPDIVVQQTDYTQSYNRYSYCFNNPLRFTDPSGYVVRGTTSSFRSLSLSFHERYSDKGAFFNTDDALGQQLPIIEPMSDEEDAAYKAFHKEVFSDDRYSDVQAEITILENAEEVFRIRMGTNRTSEAGGGNFKYNMETGEFDVNIGDYDFSTMGKLAHELKHAFQYMNGELGFDLRRGVVTHFAYDFQDEVEAFNRQGRFGNTVEFDAIKERYPDLWKKGYYQMNQTIQNCAHDVPALPFSLIKEGNKMNYNFNKKPIYLYHGWENDIQ